MSIRSAKKIETKKPDQKIVVLNGNYALAEAIVACGYEFQGYYPITPSSDAGELISSKLAKGTADLTFVVGTSELAAISICAGAAAAGARTIDVTSAQGLLLKLEELPVLSGLRQPMVMNISARAISAPLNIKCDHTDLMLALGLGWPILLAKTVQEVYDINIIAIKLAEKVQLPVIVCYDGFLTSHGNRRISIFSDVEEVKSFVGPVPKRATIFDFDDPKSFGCYMNDDLINNRYQLRIAMEQAYKELPGLFEEFYEFSGRKYELVETYGMDDNPETAVLVLNSAAEAMKDSVDTLRKKGKKAGLVIPMVLRPFPSDEMIEKLKKLKVLLVADRADQYGAYFSYLANEVGALLQSKGMVNPVILNRVFGLGGLSFNYEDGINLFEEAFAKAKGKKVQIFDYYGHWAGDTSFVPEKRIKSLTYEEQLVNVKPGLEKVNVNTLKTLASEMPSRIEKTSACPGCGIFTNLEMFLKGIDGHVILVFNTGCAEIVTSGYPMTSFKVPFVHNLFHNGSSTASGIVEHYRRLKKQGVKKEEITVIVVGGDGSSDIGMDQIIGSAIRNNPFIYFEYDNKIYANTGSQLCYTGYKGMLTTTSYFGKYQPGKPFHHKDICEIMRGTHIPFIASIAESFPEDTVRKARLAQQTVRDGGFAFLKAFSVCPLNWVVAEDSGFDLTKKMVDSCLFPLYQVVNGITTLNYDPEEKGKKIPVVEALKAMGKASSHLAQPENEWLAKEIQEETDRRWRRLRAMHASSDL